MRRLVQRLVLIGAVLVLAACDGSISIGPGGKVVGNGSITTEDRSVTDFDRVVLAGEGQVIIERGPAKLTIETDDNLLTHIDTEVANKTLEISTSSGIDIDPSDSVTYRISTERLTGITLTGAGDITTSSWESDDFSIALSGAGDIDVAMLTTGDLDVMLSGVGQVTVAGTADRLTMALPGAGNFDGADLEAASVEVTASGTGSATVWAVETLVATLSGVGSIDYFGSPTVTQTVTGVGTINSRGER